MSAQKLTPEQIETMIVGLLVDVARANPPEQFRAFLIGAIVANVAGSLPDGYWQEFLKIEICNEPGCDCCKIQRQFVETLDLLRDDRRKYLESQNRGGDYHDN